MNNTLGWGGIVRLGLVQTSLGAIVVLTTSTMNRVMVVELALPAMLPGALVALHYAVQILRPRLGHGSDVGGRRTPWIIGGMLVLALGGIGAAMATSVMATDAILGTALAVIAFCAIGLGVGAAGTSLLVLLAKRVEPTRRAAAATIVWVMMIMGFIITAGVGGHFLDPFTPARLILVTSVVGAIAVVVTLLAVWGVESGPQTVTQKPDSAPAKTDFRAALAEVWAEPEARRFTVFVFLSMLAYSMQDLILEPYAGAVFGFTPGQSTQLAGVQHGGVLAGMISVAVIATSAGKHWLGSLRYWIVAGCIGSAMSLLLLAMAGQVGAGWPLKATVFALGFTNGAFAAAAIASMMALAGAGTPGREGVRMGLWGAAQAIAFGAGGFVGTVGCDVARVWIQREADAYGLVFTIEAAMFVAAALLAMRMAQGHMRMPSFTRIFAAQQLGAGHSQGD
ncbi:MAG: BCD family MFS transporter [Burkholderiales bacterium]|nr:BCD family MFS transporter [Burkholderiales bacterium]